MKAITRTVFSLCLTLIAPNCRGQLATGTGDRSATRLQSAYIHGTIDVVVSTREGFVLATDSRGTRQKPDGTISGFSDDQQKAFTVGNTSACVVAGLIGSQMGMDGFKLRSAMGTQLEALDRAAKTQNSPMSALLIAKLFQFGLQNVSGLLQTDSSNKPDFVGEMIAISVSSSGNPEWVKVHLPVEGRTDSSVAYYVVGSPTYTEHKLNPEHRFEVDAIGMPRVVNELIGAEGPSAKRYSRTATMKMFYERKHQDALDQYTLLEAIEFARDLVAATIAAEPPGGGVGGPIDVLTVTKDGFHWIEKKKHFAPFPPPIDFMFVATSRKDDYQALDGFNFVVPTFHNMKLSFGGDKDVQLLQPTITGTCQFRILPGARRKMPAVVARLTKVLKDRNCDIVEGPEPKGTPKSGIVLPN